MLFKVIGSEFKLSIIPINCCDYRSRFIKLVQMLSKINLTKTSVTRSLLRPLRRVAALSALLALTACFSTEPQIEPNKHAQPPVEDTDVGVITNPTVDEKSSESSNPTEIQAHLDTANFEDSEVSAIEESDHAANQSAPLTSEQSKAIEPVDDVSSIEESDIKTGNTGIASQAQDSTSAVLNNSLNTEHEQEVTKPTSNGSVEFLCEEIGKKLGSVSIGDCLDVGLIDSGGRSRENRAIVFKNFDSIPEQTSLGKVLLMGGIHGDEYSSVSIVFKWLSTLDKHHSGLFEWTVVPLLNPDGLLMAQSQRQNSAGVDLNRNFPTPDWSSDAHDYWRNRTYENPRRYPGPEAASEPETRWFMEQIELINPDAIVAVHAPHRLVDYDGPQKPPHKLGKLYFQELGIYPGSLGNYAGVSKNIPVVTIELASAGIMPSDSEISAMWTDLVQWLKTEVPKQRLARSEESQ